MRDTVRRVFAIEDASKRAQAVTRDNYRGYIPFGLFRPNGTRAAPDRYEGYKLHFEIATEDPIRQECALYGPNRWPSEVPEARDIVLDYWQEMDRVATILMSALEEYLGLDSGTITRNFNKPLTNMTLLHYPRQEPDAARLGIHPHKDTDALTIIAPDPVGGLEVKSRSGQWISPDCPNDGLIVNIGDMLELWSGGRLISTPHRVLTQPSGDRYSFPYFAVPRHDVVIRPLLPALPGFSRPPVHCGHWSAEIWRTNWPDQDARADTPELGTLPS